MKTLEKAPTPLLKDTPPMGTLSQEYSNTLQLSELQTSPYSQTLKVVPIACLTTSIGWILVYLSCKIASDCFNWTLLALSQKLAPCISPAYICMPHSMYCNTRSPRSTDTWPTVDKQWWYLCSLVPRLLCVGEEKRAKYKLFANAQFHQDFWEFGNFRKICSIKLTSGRYADFSRIKDGCHWPHSV